MLGPGRAVAPYGQPSPFEAQVVRRPADAVELAYTPLQNQTGIVTPSGLCFARNHAGVARLDPRRHRLLVDGLVQRPLVFSVADVLRFPSASRIHFLECAGNGSSEWHGPQAASVQFSHGLISCCEWTGVPLRLLLEQSQPLSAAQWILAEGADGAAFDRSIPLAKALDDALLVYGQNGEMLRPEQGYPLRLILPGYEGSTNVKWLRRLTLGPRPFYTREETAKYTELLPDGKARAFDFIMDAKSVIVFPSAGQRLPGAGFYEIRGFAWSGRGRIARVEVSLDGGGSWSDATLGEPLLPRAFTRFTHDFVWDGRAASLQSRATDETGYVQPTYKRLVAVRGFFSEYHNNAIQTWKLSPLGDVTNGGG